MNENVTVGKIEQLTMSPDMKDRWEYNVQDRIARGKTINTSCVLAAQAKIDIMGAFLEEEQSESKRLASLLATAEKELQDAKELIEMSQSLVPKREPTCKTGTACMCCTLRDQYHERVAAFLERTKP